MKLHELTRCLENFAPLSLQESYDNSGLIYGTPDMEIKAALLALDCTETVVDEAIQKKCNLIITHHPIVFSGLKKITGKNYVERVLIKAIQNNIALYAIHTNFDNVAQGVNNIICEKLGLKNSKILSPKNHLLRKLITFCPVKNADKVRQALFDAGCGHIGNYDECSYNSGGFGTFRANDKANPHVGKKGKQHQEPELKIESIYPAYLENQIIKALLQSHPYEEPAYDSIQLENKFNQVGSGMIGELESPRDEMSFLKHIQKVMKADGIRYTTLLGKKVKKVAVCGGAGSFLLHDAIRAGADVFVTADFKYHQFFDADNQIVIADIGHYESEQYSMTGIAGLLKENFSKFAVHFSTITTNPVKYL